jgi:hypothetical protein
MSYASRRNVEKAGFFVAFAIAVILMTALVTITIRNANRYGLTVWQMEGLRPEHPAEHQAESPGR